MSSSSSTTSTFFIKAFSPKGPGRLYRKRSEWVNIPAFMNRTIAEIAAAVGGTLIAGDGAAAVEGLAGVEEAGPGELTFYESAKFKKHAVGSKAAGMLVKEKLEGFAGAQIATPAPYLAFTMLAGQLYPPAEPPAGIHPSAVVDPSAKVDRSASVGPQVTVERGASVGARAVLLAGAFVGPEAVIGEEVVLHPHVVVGERSRIGKKTRVH